MRDLVVCLKRENLFLVFADSGHDHWVVGLAAGIVRKELEQQAFRLGPVLRLSSLSNLGLRQIWGCLLPPPSSRHHRHHLPLPSFLHLCRGAAAMLLMSLLQAMDAGAALWMLIACSALRQLAVFGPSSIQALLLIYGPFAEEDVHRERNCESTDLSQIEMKLLWIKPGLIDRFLSTPDFSVPNRVDRVLNLPRFRLNSSIDPLRYRPILSRSPSFRKNRPDSSRQGLC